MSSFPQKSAAEPKPPGHTDHSALQHSTLGQDDPIGSGVIRERWGSGAGCRQGTATRECGVARAVVAMMAA
jgi:hypothetical protein